MKKILVLTFTIFMTGSLFSQIEKGSIKHITKIKKINRGHSIQVDTTYFKFQKGKLISFYKNHGNKTFFKYNDKGLLVEKNYLIGNSLRISNHYEYNNLGYIIKVDTKENDELTSTKNIQYDFKENNDLVITANYKDLKILKKGKKFLNKTVYNIKNKVLTLNKESVIGKFKNKSKSIFTYENENLKLAEFGLNEPKSRYTMSYSYDNKIGINTIIFKNILGDKYFINRFLIDNIPSIIRPLSYISKNNLISERVEKKSKTISVNEYESEIEYNSVEMPLKILRESKDKKIKEEIIFEYE